MERGIILVFPGIAAAYIAHMAWFFEHEKMMKPIQLLENISVKFMQPLNDKYEVIASLLDIAVAGGKVKNRDQALQSLVEREHYLSTGFENGLAVPHAKTNAIDEVTMVLGIFREGVAFDSLDKRPTHCVFLLLSPLDIRGLHIQTLALLARNFQSPDTTGQLLQAQSEDAVRERLQKFQ